MTAAMYAAVAGLKSHMTKLSVIGNNVANVNTNGYKSQRAMFRDTIYTMYSSGSGGTTTEGGKNPSQVGYGSQLSSIDLNMSTGTFAAGYSLDCMVYGDGFFMVGDKNVNIDPTNPETMKSLTMTRVGDFTFDANGYLTDGAGSCVYGFLTTGYDKEGNPIVSDQLTAIRLPQLETVEEYTKITTTTDANGEETVTRAPATAEEVTNWDKAQGDATALAGLGYTIEVASVPTVRYPVDEVEDTTAGGTGGTGTGTTAPTMVPQAITDYGTQNNVTLPRIQMDSINIDSNTGAISGTCKDTNEIIVIGYLGIANVTNPTGLESAGGSYYTAGNSAGDLQVSMMGGVAADLGIEYVNGSLYQNRLQELADDGLLGTVVEDTDGDGDVDMVDAAASVQSQKMVIGSAGGASLMTGGLEGSNVDLANEITEMITTQRGYQANSRIITVTDSMLEELVNLKR